MALPEVCSVWIEQRVAEESDTEKSGREIGRIIAAEVEKYFEVTVKPDTIRKKIERASGTNVPQSENSTESTTNDEIKEIKRAKDGTLRGGAREGSGRKKREKSQKAHWKAVERKLDSINKYIMENCRLKEENLTKTTAAEIIEQIRHLTVIQNHFLDGVVDGTWEDI